MVIQHRAGVTNQNADALSRLAQQGELNATQTVEHANLSWPDGMEEVDAPKSGVTFAAEGPALISHFQGHAVSNLCGHPIVYKDLAVSMGACEATDRLEPIKVMYLHLPDEAGPEPTPEQPSDLSNGSESVQWLEAATSEAAWTPRRLDAPAPATRSIFPLLAFDGMEADLNQYLCHQPPSSLRSSIQNPRLMLSGTAPRVVLTRTAIIRRELPWSPARLSVTNVHATTRARTAARPDPDNSRDAVEAEVDQESDEGDDEQQATDAHPTATSSVPNITPVLPDASAHDLSRTRFVAAQSQDLFCQAVTAELRGEEPCDNAEVALQASMLAHEFNLEEDGMLVHYTPNWPKSRTASVQWVVPRKLVPVVLRLCLLYTSPSPRDS